MTQQQQRYKIVYLVTGGPPIHEIMRGETHAPLELVTPNVSNRAEVIKELADADFVIAVKMDAELIAAAPKLKLIQLAGVGFDGIDLAAANARKIPVAQTVEGTIDGVAEHTMLMILGLYKHIAQADASVRRGEWLIWQLRPTSYTLLEKNVGILGFGRIGREVARRCLAFKTNIGYYDPYRAKPEVEREFSATYMEKDALLSWADVVTLHLPLAPETKNLIGEAELRRMKRTAILVNTARGGMIDEAALVKALNEGTIAGAGLDVFEKEPPGKHPIFECKNTLLSPHCATGTRDSVIAKQRAACENFLRVARGEAPENVINAAALK
jgi:lactate dehydrogenase-like 2-hydroxyacid dehydrogenase